MQNYEEIGVCGEGAFGQVLKCKSKNRGNKLVAIKRMKKSAIDDKTKREVSILQRLTHSNVVGLLDSFGDSKHLYLVFEYMDSDVMALMGAFETGMPMPRVQTITAQVCRAIDYCHREGVIHRDLKLENLLINPSSNKVKLCDFGVARHIGDGTGQYTQYVATRWYRAPELLVAPPSGESKSGQSVTFCLLFLLLLLLLLLLPITIHCCPVWLFPTTPQFSIRNLSFLLSFPCLRIIGEGLQRVVRSNNVRYSFPVDAWGIGCILAELATGCPFFPGETDLKQLAIIKAHGGQGRGVRHWTTINANEEIFILKADESPLLCVCVCLIVAIGGREL